MVPSRARSRDAHDSLPPRARAVRQPGVEAARQVDCAWRVGLASNEPRRLRGSRRHRAGDQLRSGRRRARQAQAVSRPDRAARRVRRQRREEPRRDRRSPRASTWRSLVAQIWRPRDLHSAARARSSILLLESHHSPSRAAERLPALERRAAAVDLRSNGRHLMELGVYSFADVARDPSTGQPASAEQRLADLIEEIELADQVGLDVYGVGEHHRPDYAISAPAVVLAAAAVKTRRIRLTSAVTVLSSDDPVRVFQDFATIDLLSHGRAEIMAGRGSFIESFPLFGYDLDDYDDLYVEKLDLLLQLRAGDRVTWAGKHRAPIDNLPVFPRPVQNPLPVWVAVGGSPQSVVRTGVLGLPMALAIIGGSPERFAPIVALYRDAAQRAGHDPTTIKVSINSHTYVADD